MRVESKSTFMERLLASTLAKIVIFLLGIIMLVPLLLQQYSYSADENIIHKDVSYEDSSHLKPVNETPIFELKPMPYKTVKLNYMDSIPHFFSHIPKTGATYVHDQLTKLSQATRPFADNLTYDDIHNAQKRFNETLDDADFFITTYDDDIPIDLNGTTDGYTPPVFCNQGIIGLEEIKPYQLTEDKYEIIRYFCEMTMMEYPWDPSAQNVYTIMREPLSHTFSQYFHCKESDVRVQQNRTISVTLDEWLESFANLVEQKLDRATLNKRTKQLLQSFDCFSPVESESKFTRFPIVPEGYSYPYPKTNELHRNRDDETRRIDTYLFNDLKRKYKIIGDKSQMVKTVCATFIDWTQGKHIPAVCDCTHDDGLSTTNDTHICLPDLRSRNKRCEVKLESSHSSIVSHGVQHHGDSYLENSTPKQRRLISIIRRNDQVLYNVSRAVFDEQIEEMETRYGIKICDDYRQP